MSRSRRFGRRAAHDPQSRFIVRRFAGPQAHVSALEGIRVAHLTDLHVGRVTPMEVQHAAVALTNEAEPDLVFVTGDFVCHSQLYLDALEEVMRGVEAPTICVLGNHDYWSGADEVEACLARAGALVLKNAHTTLTVSGQRLQVVGVDDAYTGHADVLRATRGLRADIPSIGLSHIAEEADACWRAGVPLVLSGHTHAGQLTVARLNELAVGKVVGHKYVHGLYGHRNMETPPHGAVYVGAGVGAAVIPWRLGDRAKREVAIFELGTPASDLVEPLREQPSMEGRKPSPRTQYRRAVVVEKNAALRARRARRRGGRGAIRLPKDD